MPYKKRWDTPTDGISRKMFDRANDRHVRRYVKLAAEVAEIRKDLAGWKAFKLHMEEEE